MELVEPIFRSPKLFSQKDIIGFLDVPLRCFYLINRVKLSPWIITHHWKFDFDAKRSGWICQDFDVLMTVSVGRVDVWLTLLTNIFKASFNAEIFGSLNFDCIYYPNSKICVLYLLSLSFITNIAIRNQSKKSDHMENSQLIWIAN